MENIFYLLYPKNWYDIDQKMICLLTTKIECDVSSIKINYRKKDIKEIKTNLFCYKKSGYINSVITKKLNAEIVHIVGEFHFFYKAILTKEEICELLEEKKLEEIKKNTIKKNIESKKTLSQSKHKNLAKVS